MDNDTRGWIMCAFSGLACIAGATVICVDIPIRLLPGKRHFRIQESNAFLASSLSLSFGVMLFSALYSMLPSAMRYLLKDNWEENKAGLIMMGCFVGGFFGIQIVSRVLHQYMPSHVVDCDHTHDHYHDEEEGLSHDHNVLSKQSSHTHHENGHTPKPNATEITPLLSGDPPRNGHIHTELVESEAAPAAEAVTHFHGTQRRASTQIKRPAAKPHNRVLSFFKDTKANCDEDGPCFGYSDPCGQECFKHIGTRTALTRNGIILSEGRDETLDGSVTTPRYSILRTPSHHAHDDDYDEDYHLHHSHEHHDEDHHDEHHTHGHNHSHDPNHDHDHDHHSSADTDADTDTTDPKHHAPTDPESQQHHHHVPANAFLSIGLQTVIAIALHKFPEGFITYATNHANPTLGFNVFMALFVHNIAEGFAMALPLYMALGSRVRAIFWSSLLGGFSQPLGAAFAVAWFKLAKRSNFEIDSTAYACLFAVTAGIMTSVALQLFVESLSLNHNRNLSIFFAFLGMALLGVSSTLVKH
ncbi:Zinc/iron permease [Chaetomium sp. MPI-SDFR-AT-0129]|nr:Zinc/iron permease [Chaetomium sp. MPI-SDFR-AT-0129]